MRFVFNILHLHIRKGRHFHERCIFILKFLRLKMLLKECESQMDRQNTEGPKIKTEFTKKFIFLFRSGKNIVMITQI